MARDRWAAVGIGLLLTGTTVLSACTSGGSTPSENSGSGGGGGQAGRIYVITPLSGGDAALGLGVRNSVQLAVKKAKERGALEGWNIEVVPLDDKGDKAAAKAAAEKAAADDQTLAVVGSIYSGLTLATQEPLSKAGIPQVAPSATNPTLTKGEDYTTSPKRPHANFFRVIAPDDAHAPALSDYVRAAGVARVAIVHDGDSYGQGLAKAFSAAFTKAGGQVVSVDKVDPKAPATYPDLVRKLVELKPQAVMFGGNDPQGGPLSGQLKEAGLTVPVIGGDALGTAMYVARSGPVSGGDVSTAAGAPLSTVEGGKQYLADYRASGFTESATSYGPLGYDAANAVLTALETSLAGAGSAKDSRPRTVEALADVAFDGTSGKVAFDGYGDITPRVVTVNVLNGGAWKPAQTFTLN